MRATLDLAAGLAKCCVCLALVRLAASAFNWEFGVSRHYLRLLEWLFELGRERVRRVESKHKLHLEQCLANARGCDQKEAGPGVCCDARCKLGAEPQIEAFAEEQEEEEEEVGEQVRPLKEAPNNQTLGRAKLATANWLAQRRENSPPVESDGRQRMRRTSRPDGPPVFLLDDILAEPAQSGSVAPDERRASGRVDSSEACAGPDKLQEFHLEHATRFVARGLVAIIDDQVTKRFEADQLESWNLLTRTNARHYQFESRSLALGWLFGLMCRYLVLLPLRIVFTLTGFLWLVSTMLLIGLLPRPWRRRPYKATSLMAFRLLACGITSRLQFHNRHFRAQLGDVCVANHTSPIDVILMGCDNCYALVGQRHGGLLGLLERALSRATNHVWFDRGEMRDRRLVTERLREHVAHGSNLPVLIFPEGTCINNSAVMMFRKGSFETTRRICPAAIKYDSRFGDPFWNSSKQGYLHYLLMMMSSWAIKCEVWYLEPMERLEGESSAEFANRVKASIARQGGLVDLAWDGQLKRSSVKPSWLYQQQEDYANRLKLE